MIFKVTKTLISNGIIGKCQYCPVSLSIKEKLNTDTVMITHNSIGIKYPEGKYTFLEIPANVKRFVMDFDAGKPVSPFEFQLDI